MRDRSNRDVTFLDVIIKAEPEHAPRQSITYFLDKVNELFVANNTEKWNKNRTQKIYISDIEINTNEKYALFLLCYNNGDASSASYSHLDTNQLRREPAQPREGRPESSHFLVKLDSTSQGQSRHIALLEDSSKINRKVIQSYFNFLFGEMKKIDPDNFQANHPDGSLNRDNTPKKYKFSNKFELQGHPSEEFQSMLNDGKLTGIVLETSQHEHMVIGDGSFVVPSKNEIRLKPTTGKWHENGINRLKESLSLAKAKKYEKARVTFVATDTKAHTVHIDTTTENVIGDSFIMKKRLSDFTSLLEEADDKINSEIKSKMLAIF